MSTAIVTAIPQQLIERLHGAGDRPTVPAADREQALAWLRCALVDITALLTHIALLQRLAGGAAFRLPGSRRDGPAADPPPPPDLRFRFRDVWFDERIVPILDGGVEALSDDALGELLLNPYAMADLQDMISETSPDAWLEVIHVVGREMMRREGVRPRSAPPAVVPARAGGPRSLTGGARWRWAAGGAAVTAAVIAIGFAALQYRPPGSGTDTPSTRPLRMTADKADTPVGWKLTLDNHYDERATPEENLAQLEKVSSGVQKEAAAMRRAKPDVTAREILTAVFDGWGWPNENRRIP